MSISLREYVYYYLEHILLHTIKAIRLAAMKSSPNYTKQHKKKLWVLCKQVKKLLTFRGLSLIIIVIALSGCGTMKSSMPQIHSCVDLTTYVNNGQTAAQVISKERVCEVERLRSMGINTGE